MFALFWILVLISFNLTPALTQVAAAADTTINTSPKKATEAANYVLKSLHDVSGSGIYSNLRIGSIRDAREADGLHFNTDVTLSLDISSDHFASGNDTETFKMIVMEDEGQFVGYAIDRFPKMNEDDINQASKRTIEAKRKESQLVRREVLSQK